MPCCCIASFRRGSGGGLVDDSVWLLLLRDWCDDMIREGLFGGACKDPLLARIHGRCELEMIELYLSKERMK